MAVFIPLSTLLTAMLIAFMMGMITSFVMVVHAAMRPKK
jgi:hypothetical protein